MCFARPFGFGIETPHVTDFVTPRHTGKSNFSSVKCHERISGAESTCHAFLQDSSFSGG